MLPLAILSACAAALLLPASAAPLPFQNPGLQRPTGVLAPPPEQLVGNYDGSSGAAPWTRGAPRVPRGVGFREADYAVNAATAVQTAIPTQSAKASPALFVAAARAVHPRQFCGPHVGCVVFTGTPASNPDADPSAVPLSESQPSVHPLLNPAGLSVSNNAPTPSSANAPGPEVRPHAVRDEAKADPVLSQSQQDDDALTSYSTDATSLPLAQVNAPLFTVSGTGDPSLPKALHPSSNSGFSPSQTHKIGTVAVGSHERRGHALAARDRRRLRPTRYLSGSTLYPAEDPSPQPVNPRAVEQLAVEGPAPRKSLKGDTGVMRLDAIPDEGVVPGLGPETSIQLGPAAY
ncbi:hypothetical protein GSI_01482 [Ganoderma sinense ZZ0214-1]|uniref:Transporter n=1 Tax=Ganoderma sinense ZZ0214-1 TaxID=1077348 RepID=A0A2G8SPZ9_9APHY|nr:hypothetical protein GSI_01482 [Ganoderma sinense ZZ0214-1]